MQTKETKELALVVPATVAGIETLILDLEGSSSHNDSLSVETAMSVDGGDYGVTWDTFTLVDSGGFPLLTVTLRPEA